ncbi:MAG TPA: ATP-binding cassette domain-containing protein [Geobacteraceae bacterium]|nr:ATP-binding cassette domain-containing protein [Geobacteraceae bacterium]
MRQDMLTVTNLSYTYPEEHQPSLKDISFTVAGGECVCFNGHSGCGKTTLLLALKGLLAEENLEGTIKYGGAPMNREEILAAVGLVFQNAESQLLCSTVFDEVAFGPENICIPPAEIYQRIVESLTAVDLLEFGNRNVERFSAGQKQRLCIASVLSMHPRVILLDEPTSQLDGKGKSDLLKTLRLLKSQGISIIIAEHNIEPFTGIIDRYYLMAAGEITSVQDHAPEEYRYGYGTSTPVERRKRPADSSEPLVSADSVFVSYAGSANILNSVSLEIMPGELLHLYGENGCGKSTLLKTMAGAIRPDSGLLTISGRDFPKAGGLLGIVALLFQNPQRQLFEDTVQDEIAFTLKRLELPTEKIERTVEFTLTLCEVIHLKDRLPLTLSFGEQHRVALASVIAPDPKLLLLDEPFAGLDPTQRLRLLKILTRLREESNTAIVIASHDPLPDPCWADRIITMQNGEIVPPEVSPL